MIHYKALLLAIKYVIDARDYCYQMKPNRKLNGSWEPHEYSDTDYSGDNDTWKSVTGDIVITNRLVIDWSSKIYKTVTLYVTEA